MSEPWWEFALKIIGTIAVLTPVVLWVANRGRKQANLAVSKTETEIYKQLVEKKLSELNIADIIEKRVDDKVNEFKRILWDATQRHYYEKMELKAELEESYKRNQELLGRVDKLEEQVHELTINQNK